MEGRCAVDTWTEFGFLRASNTPKVELVVGTHVVVCTGNEEVYVFNVQEKRFAAVLQFPEVVVDLIESHDKHLLVACCSGVYCVDLQPLLVRPHGSSTSSDPAELKISSEFCVLGGRGLWSLLLVGPLLLTLGQRNASWLLTLYKTAQQKQPGSYEMLRSFSLPQLSPVLQGSAETEHTRRSLLICVHSGRPTLPVPSGSHLTHRQFGIEPVLFKLLFGVDAALAKSPVVIWGLPDGRLCFLPLHLSGSQIRVLHSLEQPVAFVGASVVSETDPGQAQCLVAVGERGRVVLIRTDRSGPEAGGSTAGFPEWCVPGPVKCCCVDNNRLYYSTGSDLLTLNLLGSSGRQDAAVQIPTSLNVCRVIALAVHTCNEAGEVQLIGLSDRGTLSGIKLPNGEQEVGMSKLPASQVGRSVRDLSSAIGDICERASALKTVIKSQNLTLKRLNQVVNTCFLLKSPKEHLPTEEKPIRCCATVDWSRLLLKDSLNLTCVLENSSSYTLERGWTLCISIFPLSCSPVEAEEASSNFTFPILNLSPGGALEVSVPVAAAGGAAFPLTVNCSLAFSLLGVLEEEELEGIAGLQSSSFTFSLNSLTVDWLHVLQVIGPTAAQRSRATTDAVQAFLSSRQMKRHQGADGGGENSAVYSACVWVSLELLRDTLRTRRLGLGTSEKESAPLSLSLLNWLLFESHGGVKMGRRGDQDGTSSSEVHARSPNKATVKLSVKEVNEENSVKEAHVEVQIESSSVAAVCGLRHAVLRRLQSLLAMVPVETAAPKMVQISDLKSALQKAEIQQSRISEALSSDMSSAQMNPFPLDVYQKLRENRLLMI